MFKIKSEPFGECNIVKIINEVTGEYVSVIPDYGATLNQIKLRGNDGRLHELLNSNQTYESLIAEEGMFKGSKLFPFPNRIKNGKYKFNNKEYSLPVNHVSEGHAIHGLVYKRKFQIVEEYTALDTASLVLEHKFEGEKGYPFKFTLRIIFKLGRNTFCINTEVKNDDTIEIPVGGGWHPYFKIGNIVDELYLTIPSTKIVEIDDNMIPTGTYNEYHYKNISRKIGEENFDHCFKLIEEDSKCEVKLADRKQNIFITIWIESGLNNYRYVQLYTPPCRTSLAIEPMTCLPDAFNNNEGLIRMSPGESHQWRWGCTLS